MMIQESSNASNGGSLLLKKAKVGGVAELGNLLAHYSNYLKVLARTQLDRRLHRRLSPSDLVQEALLEAHRDFSKFRGESLGEFVAWLRRILVSNLIRATEQHLNADKRDVRREVSLREIGRSIEHSASRLENFAASDHASPCSEVFRHERIAMLADAIARLPHEQQQVIMLRHIEGRPFAEIAIELRKSSGACRMLWLRAIDHLQQVLRIREGE
jgi:RNA polymerase sigma-70 factor (ECF subfamily)